MVPRIVPQDLLMTAVHIDHSLSYNSYVEVTDFIDSMVRSRSTPLYRSLEHSNTSALGDDMKKSSACISVDGTDAKRLMVRSTI